MYSCSSRIGIEKAERRRRLCLSTFHAATSGCACRLCYLRPLQRSRARRPRRHGAGPRHRISDVCASANTGAAVLEQRLRCRPSHCCHAVRLSAEHLCRLQLLRKRRNEASRPRQSHHQRGGPVLLVFQSPRVRYDWSIFCRHMRDSSRGGCHCMPVSRASINLAAIKSTTCHACHRV